MITTPTAGRAKHLAVVYLVFVTIVVAFASGLLIGQSVHSAIASFGSQKVASSVQLDLSTISAQPAIAGNVDFNQFWQVWSQIKERYVKTDVKDEDLFYGAMQGLVAGIGDPYSVYFPPKPAEEFAKSLAGEFSGIGAEIGIKNNQLLIISPLPKTPAERAGLRPGDKIVAIDKKSTVGMDSTSAVNLIRGPANTTTTLTIARDGAKTKDYVLTREKINIPAVIYEVLPGKIVHLRIMQFNENTMPEMEKYIPLITKDAKGIIVDLRNNPGGYLDSAVFLASEWLSSGRIVSERFRDGSENIHSTVGQHRLYGIPTVVLINGGSASASEIVAGALRDQGAARLIGEKSFGKGSVQDYQELPGGAALKLTIAEWYTPKGTNINKTGILPDVEVKQDFTKEKIGQDIMIKKAIQVLRTIPFTK